LKQGTRGGYITDMQEAGLLTANEAAVLVGVSPDLIRRYVSSGRLSAVRNGRAIRISRDSISKLVRQCGRCHERFVPKNAGLETTFCPACAPLERREATRSMT
jgi:excisionase family DNA binding protein